MRYALIVFSSRPFWNRQADRYCACHVDRLSILEPSSVVDKNNHSWHGIGCRGVISQVREKTGRDGSVSYKADKKRIVLEMKYAPKSSKNRRDLITQRVMRSRRFYLRFNIIHSIPILVEINYNTISKQDSMNKFSKGYS